ncbi:MAG TPA: hypothetical protein VFC77_01740 [Myxococcota bacterium]|nr:hypothetical protein [Myxococcota bacterium]
MGKRRGTRATVRGIGRELWLGAPLALALLGAAPPEWTEPSEQAPPPPPTVTISRTAPYEPLRAGHPLRIAAYILHPIGVILDYAIMRPAYWIGSHEPIRTLVGQTD